MIDDININCVDIWITLTIITVITIAAGGMYIDWQIDRDIVSKIDRAEVSGNAQDMNMYLKQAKEGMEKWDYTDGHYALIFKTSWNDASKDYRVVKSTINRTEVLMEMNKSSTAYQAGMDDVRGIIRDIEFGIYRHWSYNQMLGNIWLIYSFTAWWVIPISSAYGYEKYNNN